MKLVGAQSTGNSNDRHTVPSASDSSPAGTAEHLLAVGLSLALLDPFVPSAFSAVATARLGSGRSPARSY